MTATFPPPTPTKTWRNTNVCGGINKSDLEFLLPANQTSDALNVMPDNGVLRKRWGFKNILSTPLPGTTYAAHKELYKGFLIVHNGTKLIKIDPVTGASTDLYTSLAAQKGSFFQYNGKLYYINGAQYVSYDGTTCAPVVPFIPNVIINRTPTGGGSVDSDYNRLGSGFKNSFNGNNSATAFTLTQTNLDATAVTALVDNVAKVEGTNFDVNRTTGVVTFRSGNVPATGTNNVIITAFKTNQTYIDSILKCKYAAAFGGENDSRLFFGGNGTSTYYYTGLKDPSYWPETQWNTVGANNSEITGFAVQYSTLAVFTPSEMYGVTYQLNASGDPVFYCVPISPVTGCDAPDSIQVINSQLTWANAFSGIHTLVSTQIKEERNTPAISINIDQDLLAEVNLKNAASVDYKGKYWLSVPGGNTYCWDYAISPYTISTKPEQDAKRLSWWIFNGINVIGFVVSEELMGVTATGQFVRFIESGSQSFADNGVAIPARYKVPLRDFGGGKYQFDVKKVRIDCRADTKTQIDLDYITDKRPNGYAEPVPIVVGSFSLKNFSLQNFTLQVVRYAKTFVRKPNAKRIALFGMELSNNDVGRDLSISSISLDFTVSKEKR